jgi:chromate transporter
MLSSLLELFWIFLRLGLTSFGGPIAHLGFFHNEFVTRRKWFEEQAYVDLVALCQFLPGPASSQVGMAIGMNRAGVLGAVVAWIGFTLPSAIILVLFGLGITRYAINLNAGWLHALKVAAVAVVAQAIWAMGIKLCPDKERVAIAALACTITLLISSAWVQILVIAGGGIAGVYFLRNLTQLPHVPVKSKLSKKNGVWFLSVFALLLIILPFAARISQNQSVKLVDSFYRAGSLVFGGGHVVLPLLQSEVVPTGWVSENLFMAGYGAAQAIPGPLFTFSAYLGAVSNLSPSGWLGAFICLIAAFLPSFLLIAGVLPFWEDLREHPQMRFAMLGINAAVVGLLMSAFYHPVWTSGILSVKDFALALVAFIFLTFFRTPAWAVVTACAIFGAFVQLT